MNYIFELSSSLDGRGRSAPTPRTDPEPRGGEKPPKAPRSGRAGPNPEDDGGAPCVADGLQAGSVPGGGVRAQLGTLKAADVVSACRSGNQAVDPSLTRTYIRKLKI
jgi:hypothetical protein